MEIPISKEEVEKEGQRETLEMVPKQLQQPEQRELFRPENPSSCLPPLRAPKAMSMKAPKSLLKLSQSQKISKNDIILSLNKRLRDDRFLSNYMKEQRKKMDNLSLKPLQDQQRKPVFRSAKMGTNSKKREVQIRPQLQSMKDQYKVREASIERFLSQSQLLDNYKMLSHLGKGSFSVVSLAVQRSTNKRFAIKTYTKIDEIENYKFDNIYREVSNLHNLSHQNVVGLYHVIKDKRKLLLVMEDGGKSSLAGILRKNRTIPEEEAKVLFRKLTQGVRYCHEQKVCHRDLKLENVLVDSAGQVKIIDFGFSSKSGQKMQNFCGTPPYMAPEIAAKVPYWGEPADMWALGVMLYLMLFGKFPFRATSEKELYRLIQQGKFQMGSEVSLHAKQTISKLLKCNMRDRATADQILQGRWLKQPTEKL